MSSGFDVRQAGAGNQESRAPRLVYGILYYIDLDRFKRCAGVFPWAQVHCA